MQELIKGSLKPIIVEGDITINNHINKDVKPKGADQPQRKNREADFELDFDDELSETGEPKEHQPEQEKEPVPEFVTAREPDYALIALSDLEALREHFRSEGESQAQDIVRKAQIELARAKEDADKIRQQAENQRLEKLRAIEADAAKAYEKAQKTGFEAGYNDGFKKGSDEGYEQGQNKCRDALLDLKNICEGVEKEKAALMAENRRGIFDIALTVAEKITMTVFRQRDKQALEKMITEAAKEFRNAKSIRVSLSKLDLSEDVTVDIKLLEKCFDKTVQVEFEVLEDADEGTLLMETDSEILDAGVSTQLRMIEELGKGKFRDREPDSVDTEEAVELEEVVKIERPKKTRKAKEAKEQLKEPEIVEEAMPEPVEAIAATATELVEAVVEAVESVAAAQPVEEAAEEAVAAAAAKARSTKATAEEPAAAPPMTAQPVEAAEEVTAENTAEEQEATEEQ